ncbi:MAG: hypothetical protein QM723_10790 [Myxococcaceae bacterium]
MPVTLTPVHLVRAGTGSDAIRLHVRGFGLLLGSLGTFFVRGNLDRVVLRRFPGPRVRVFFFGLPFFSWRSVALAPQAKLDVPRVERAAAPRLPRAAPAPSLEFHLTITPPEAP